ncbi:MAG: hypothetical protein IJ736_15520, partial [Firmicutes bacterium]|nr:hypothetical protein [Bacillota bacterium]
LSKILQSDDPENKFYEIFYDRFYEFEYISCLTEIVKNDCPEFYDKYKDDINTWILEHTSILFPYDDFFSQKYPVDIIIDTGDANYDFVLNCVYPHYNGRIEDNIEDEAAILWLAKENGYSKNDLEAALKYEKFNGSKFWNHCITNSITVQVT